MYAIMSFINTQFISNIYTSYFLFLKNWPRPLVQYWIIKKGILFVAVVVQSLSHVRIFVAPWTTAHQVPLFSTDSRVCSNSCPLSRWCYLTISTSSPPSPFAFNPSQHQGLFQRVSSSYQVAKVLELQLQQQSFQWIFRFISFRIDWFHFIVQGTLESLLQHHTAYNAFCWFTINCIFCRFLEDALY